MKILIALLLVSVTHLSQAAAYIKFDGVDGEAKASQDAASGQPTGKRQHKPLSVTKPVDKATPLLMKAADCVDDTVVRGPHQGKACEHRGHVTVLK